MIEQVRTDGRRVFSPRSFVILAAGGTLAGVATRMDEPSRTARMLHQPGLEAASDFGNVYGGTTTLASGAIG